MDISQIIKDKIITDVEFRRGAAMALGISEQGVKKLAQTNSDNLTKIAAIAYYLSQGIPGEDLFTEKLTSISIECH